MESHQTIEAAAAKLLSAERFINGRLINRKRVVRQAMYALLTGEHLLLQSRTGAGKTLLADQVFSVFTGQRVFKVQASKEQQPDTYFGGLDIEQLKKGHMTHNTTGSLVESEFGFIDEIFDANDFTLRALLSLLNERRLSRGTQQVDASIHSVFAATNYLRVSEITEAVLDRFLFQAVILPDKNPYVQYRIGRKYLTHSGDIAAPTTSIPYSDLQQWTNIVGGKSEIDISVPSDVLYFLNLVAGHYEYARIRAEKDRKQPGVGEFYISPRKQAKAVDMLRAHAFMQGRSSVVMEDVAESVAVFATLGMEEHENLFKKSYSSLVNTLSVSNGFSQLKVLLGFHDLLNEIEMNPDLMNAPLSKLDATPVRRTFLDWVKESLGGADSSFAQNKKLLEGYLSEFIPVCDEIRDLKSSLELELREFLQDLAKHGNS